MARPKKSITKEQWIAAAIGCAGVITAMAGKLGCNRKTVQRELERSEWLREAVREATDIAVDMAETNIMDAIRHGNMKVTMWYLDRKGKGRGYGKELKIEGDANLGGNVEYHVYIPDNGRNQEEQQT